jgi:hypothetical protein
VTTGGKAEVYRGSGLRVSPWEQAGADLPDWQGSYQRLVADGEAASLADATEAHHTRDFPAPVVPS